MYSWIQPYKYKKKKPLHSIQIVYVQNIQTNGPTKFFKDKNPGGLATFIILDSGFRMHSQLN